MLEVEHDKILLTWRCVTKYTCIRSVRTMTKALVGVIYILRKRPISLSRNSSEAIQSRNYLSYDV